MTVVFSSCQAGLGSTTVTLTTSNKVVQISGTAPIYGNVNGAGTMFTMTAGALKANRATAFKCHKIKIVWLATLKSNTWARLFLTSYIANEEN